MREEGGLLVGVLQLPRDAAEAGVHLEEAQVAVRPPRARRAAQRRQHQRAVQPVRHADDGGELRGEVLYA